MYLKRGPCACFNINFERSDRRSEVNSIFFFAYSQVSNKRVYTRTCILAKFPLYTALLDTYTTPCKSKTWWANFFDKLKKLKLLDKNVAQDIEQDQNEHKTYENHNSYAHWTWCLKVAMLKMYREFSKSTIHAY